MAASLQRPVPRVTYRPVQTVERVLRRELGCASEGAAHQRLLRIRREHASAVRSFLEAGAAGRLTWFMEPTEELLSGQAVQALTADLLVDAARIDGREHATLTELAAHLNDPVIARTELRNALHEITAMQAVARAICHRHGWTL
jgi:cation transport regulator ChaC